MDGERKGRRWHFKVRVKDPEVKSSTCGKCGGVVKRSWVTGILHRNCRACRELIMMYGPSISVRRIA
jgi:hypothetical protein